MTIYPKTMIQQIILHVPHSSLKIPVYEGYKVDQDALEQEMYLLTDWYTDDIFHQDRDIMIRADFSRIFCDVERFAVDAQEVMAAYGMGVLYERKDDGDILREVSETLKQKVLDEFYWPHHKALSGAVSKQLEQYGRSLILDCHSFPDTPFKRDMDKNPFRPDFNIGTDPYHTPKALIDFSVEFFERSGYSLGVDWPYKGSLVPLEHYQKNRKVHSIMLEINRKLYLKGSANERSGNYEEIKKVVRAFISEMKENF